MFKPTPQTRELFVRTLEALALRVFAISAVLVFGVLFASVARPVNTFAVTSNTINFQARLENADGSIAPDGNYNVEFKLYNALTPLGTPDQGACTDSGGTPDADCLWVETRIGANTVKVVNGYLTVNLGSVTPFPATMDWSQQLYLTMNVGGDGATPTWDGEMNPRLQLTAVPYALDAQQLGGVDASKYARQDASNAFTGATNTFDLPTSGVAVLQNATTTAGLLSLDPEATSSLALQVKSGSSTELSIDGNGNVVSQGNGTFATVNGTTGINTGTGSGTQRIDASGNLLNIGNISGSGTLQLSGTTGSSYIMSALGVGTASPQAGSALTIGNGSWISGVAAGGGYINMFQVNSNNEIQVGAALNVDGGITLPSDSGALTLVDEPFATSGVSAGTASSYTLGIGQSNALTVYGENDGSGNAQNVRVSIGSSITPQYTLDVNGTAGTLFGVDTTNNQVLFGNSATNAKLVLNSSGGSAINILAPSSAAGYTITLPAAAPAASQCLQTSSSDATLLAWSACGVSSLNTFSGAITLQGTTDEITVTNNAGTITLSTPQAINTTSNVTFASGTFNNVTVASSGYILLNGGTTRPSSPAEGTLYYDTTTKELLIYSNGKWQADRSTATKVVAASTSTQAEKDAADYVATGTGDQATINSALTAVGSGGTVYLMEGTYIISASISIPNNVTLAGAGAGTIITLPNNQNGTYSMVTNTDQSTGTGVVIRGVTLNGNRANQTSGEMRGVYLKGLGGGSGSSTRSGATVTKVTVRSIADIDGGYVTDGGITLDATSNSTVTDNTLIDNQNVGIGLFNSSYNVVSNNSLSAQGSAGIYLYGSTNNALTGNNIVNGGIDGININGASADNTITGNTVSQNVDVAISVSSSNDNLISANTFDTSNNGGIDLYNAANTVVSNNAVHDNGAASSNWGIRVISSSKVSVTGNVITDTSCTSTCYAIYLQDLADVSTYLANNTFSGDGTHTATISDAGTGTIYANQQDASGNFVNKSQGGGFAIGASSATASLTLQGGLQVSALPNPAAPTATANTTGTTSYTYAVAAYDGLATTGATAMASPLTTGAATPDNTITWTAVSGAVKYYIYRISGGATQGLIGTVDGNSLSFIDNNASGDGTTAPSVNTTGGASFAGFLQGTTASLSGTNSLTVGTASSATGQITFFNSAGVGSIVLQATATSGSYTINLPAANGTLCLDSGNCNGGGANGGYIVNGTTQQVANFNIKSAAAGSVGALIQGANSATQPVMIIRGGKTPGTGGDLLDLQTWDGTTATTVASFDKSGGLTAPTVSSTALSVTNVTNGKITANIFDSSIATFGLVNGKWISSSSSTGLAASSIGGIAGLFTTATVDIGGGTFTGDGSPTLVSRQSANNTQVSSLLELQGSNKEVLSKFDAQGQLASYGTNTSLLNLSVPSGWAAAAPTGTDGTWSATGTYFWVITAVNSQGETVASGAVSQAVTATNQHVVLSWTQVTGATGYRIYRNSTGTFTAGNLCSTYISSGATVTFTATGAATSDCSTLNPGGISTPLPPTTPGGTGLILQGWSGQTADLLQAQNSAGTALAGITSAGKVYFNSGSASAPGLYVSGDVNTGLYSPGADTLSVSAGGSNVATFGATAINLNQNVTVANGKTLTINGDTTANRPTTVAEGMLYYDTTTKKLLVYSNGKWQADRSTATKIVAMGTATGCTGTSPVSSQNPDSADYVVTSCTSAQATINLAISQLPAGGGTVYLEEGTYIIDGSITVPSSITLTGSGPSTIIKFKDSMPSTSGTPAITNQDQTNGNSHVTISNLKLDGNKSNQTNLTQEGFSTSGTTNADYKLSGLYIENFSSFAGSLPNGSIMTDTVIDNNNSSFGITFLTGTGATLKNITYYGNSQGLTLGNYSAITNSSLYSNTADGLKVSTYDTVTNNVINSNSLNGINSTGTNSTITGNSISNNSSSGISISSNNNVISNNTIYNNGSSGSASSISMGASAANNIVTGNMIIDTAGTGFAIADSGLTNNYSNNVYSGTGASSISYAYSMQAYNASGQLDASGNQIYMSVNGTNIFRESYGKTADLIQGADSSGTKVFGVTNTGALQSSSLDAVSSGTLSVGTSTASAITIGKAGITTTVSGNLAVTTSVAPTANMLDISNSGQAVTANNVNGLHVDYTGGAAAVEGAGMRIDYTPGGTSGGTWSGMRIVANATGAASGVNEYGIKLEGPSSPGSGTETAIKIASGWDIGVDIGSGGLQLSSQTDPSSPAANTLRVFARTINGRPMLKVTGPNGDAYPVQASLFQNYVTILSPQGSTINSFGSGFQNAGTLSAATSDETYGMSANITSNATVNAGAGLGTVGTYYYRGSTTGANGFFTVERAGFPDASYGSGSTGARIFAGMTDQTVANATATTDPTGNRVGFSYDTSRGDSDFMIVAKDGTTQSTPADTGMVFTAQHEYDFYLYSPPYPNNAIIYWRIDDLTAGTSDEGTIASNLPTASTAMRPSVGVGTLTTVARNIKIQHIYVETNR